MCIRKALGYDSLGEGGLLKPQALTVFSDQHWSGQLGGMTPWGRRGPGWPALGTWGCELTFCLGDDTGRGKQGPEGSSPGQE